MAQSISAQRESMRRHSLEMVARAFSVSLACLPASNESRARFDGSMLSSSPSGCSVRSTPSAAHSAYPSMSYHLSSTTVREHLRLIYSITLLTIAPGSKLQDERQSKYQSVTGVDQNLMEFCYRRSPMGFYGSEHSSSLPRGVRS
jgi:hypothetical protein